MQMTGDAADGAHGDESGKKAFVALENFEAGFGPKLAALPAKFGAEAAQPGYRGGLLRQMRKRANVVALAKAAVRLRSSMPTKKHIQRNLLRWVKLISLHLQRAGGGGFVQICVLNEERARAGSRGGGYLQRKVKDAEASGLLGEDRAVAGPGDGVGHLGIQTAGRKPPHAHVDNSRGGPLQRHRISGE